MKKVWVWTSAKNTCRRKCQYFRNWRLFWYRNGNSTLNTDWDAWLREWGDVFRNCTGYEAVRLVIDCIMSNKCSQTVTPAPPNAVVHTICSCRNAVFLGLHTRTRPSTGVNKNHFHPTSALSATTWYSIPYGHVPIKAWLFCGVLSVADALVRNVVLLRRLLRVRLLMCLLTIHRLRSVFAVLNGHCLASVQYR
jgi:hypothetical protein